MRLAPCGDAALLVELDDLDQTLALYAELSRHRLPGVVDLVPAARTVLVRIDRSKVRLTDVAEVVASVRLQPGERPDAGRVEIEVSYDGEDLAEVGELTGLGERGVVEAHTGQEWTVAFAGFAPGFGYLVGTSDALHVPRRSTPRTRVPAGAVALAGEFTGVYPRESPGGWQLIGTCRRRMWDPDRTPPAVLAAGLRVRFVEA